MTEYGKELLSKGGFTWMRNNKTYRGGLTIDFEMEWLAHSDVFDHASSGEKIIFISAYKKGLKCHLHFAWKTIAYVREVDNKHDILEIFEETQYQEIGYREALSIIKKASPKWWMTYKDLIPGNVKVHLIWDDGLDTYLVFEMEHTYIGWNWSSSA